MDIKKLDVKIPEINENIVAQNTNEAKPAGVAGSQDSIEAVKDAAANSELFQQAIENQADDSPAAGQPDSIVNAKLSNLDTDALIAHIRDLIEAVDFSKLENLEKVVRAIAPEITDSQLERLIGSGINTGKAKGVLDSIRDTAGQPRDRAGELVGSKLDDLRMVGSGLFSEEPAAGSGGGNEGTQVEPPTVKDILINFILGLGSSKSPVPLPPTPPDAETGRSMWDGVTFFQEVLGTGNYGNHVNNRGGIDTNGTPNPDAPDSGGPTVITKEMLIGIAARLGSKGEPNPESQDGGGGPINETKASGGATGPAGEPAVEIDRAVVTSRDIDAIRIKLESKFIKP